MNILSWKHDATLPGGDIWWNNFPEIKERVFSGKGNAENAKKAYELIFMPWEQNDPIPELADTLEESDSILIVK